MREHGNHKRLPHNAMSFEETKYVVRFLQNYAEANAILLPGRIPGYKRDDLQLLPSHTTKKVNKTVHREPGHQQRNWHCVLYLFSLPFRTCGLYTKRPVQRQTSGQQSIQPFAGIGEHSYPT